MRFWTREIGGVARAVCLAHVDRAAGLHSRSYDRELRIALRTLARRPLFAAGVVLVLGLGIGANAGVNGIGWAVFRAPLPYPEAERLVRVFHDDDLTFGISLNELLNYRARSRTLTGVAGWTLRESTLEDATHSVRTVVALVTPDLFPVLGRRPDLGSHLSGAGPEVLISHRFWSGQFGRDPSVIGSTLVLDGVPHIAVGVLPPDVTFPDGAVDLYAGIDMAPRGAGRGGLFLDVVARLAPRATLPATSAEVDALARAMRQSDPASYAAEPRFGGHVAPFRSVHVRADRPLLLALGAGAALVFLAACLNVALLLFERARGRRQEMAVRAALGAGQGALLRLHLVESALLAIGGAAFGALLGTLTARFVGAWVPEGLALAGGRIFRPVIGAAMATGAGAGLLLALGGWLSSRRLQERPGHDGASTRLGPMRYVLPAGQIALAVTLITGCFLLLSTVRGLVAVDLGFRVEGVVSGRIDLPPTRYGEGDRHAFYERLVDRLNADPRVRSAGLVNALPMSGVGSSGDVYVEDLSADSALDVVAQRVADPGYFQAAGIPLSAGRSFEDGDDEGAPRVAIVDRSFAGRFFGAPERAIGRRIRFFFGGEGWNTIVGVVEDVRHGGPAVNRTPHVYVPFAQRPPRGAYVVVAHDAVADATAVRALRAAAEAVDAGVPLFDLASMKTRLRSVLGRERSALALFTASGALALLLAGIGTYTVVALGQQARTRELGIRRALGATSVQIARTVTVDAAITLGVGCAAGWVGSALVVGVLSTLLPTGMAHSSWHPLAASGLLFVSSLAALLPPLMRALEVQPRAILSAD